MGKDAGPDSLLSHNLLWVKKGYEILSQRFLLGQRNSSIQCPEESLGGSYSSSVQMVSAVGNGTTIISGSMM